MEEILTSVPHNQHNLLRYPQQKPSCTQQGTRSVLTSGWCPKSRKPNAHTQIKNKWCDIVFFNGSSFGARKKVLTRRWGDFDGHLGIENRRREQQAEYAWSQFQMKHLGAAAEESVETTKEGRETEVEQGWTKVIKPKRKGLCTSADVLVAESRYSLRYPDRHTWKHRSQVIWPDGRPQIASHLTWWPPNKNRQNTLISLRTGVNDSRTPRVGRTSWQLLSRSHKSTPALHTPCPYRVANPFGAEHCVC